MPKSCTELCSGAGLTLYWEVLYNNRRRKHESISTRNWPVGSKTGRRYRWTRSGLSGAQRVRRARTGSCADCFAVGGGFPGRRCGAHGVVSPRSARCALVAGDDSTGQPISVEDHHTQMTARTDGFRRATRRQPMRAALFHL